MAPLNIFVLQVFIQQCLSEGDPNAACNINTTGITLDWTSDDDKVTSKYVPLNKSNIGIHFTVSGFQNFQSYAALCGMPATHF